MTQRGAAKRDGIVAQSPCEGEAAGRAARHALRVQRGTWLSTVCAWCGVPIGRALACAGYERNFGMCRACVVEAVARLAPRPVLETAPAIELPPQGPRRARRSRVARVRERAPALAASP
jgi:hypothetical protein